MPNLPKHEVFLSHASQDEDSARQLRDILVAHGVPVWFSPHHLRGAQQWPDEIGKALARCDWFMLLLTPHALKSMWVKRELNYALIQERLDKRIIPLLFKKCNFAALLDVNAVPSDRFHHGLLGSLRRTASHLEKTPQASCSAKVQPIKKWCRPLPFIRMITGSPTLG